MPVHPEPRRPTEQARLELVKLPPETHLADVFARACELAARAIDVERVGVWLFVDDQTALRCAALFERSKREHSTGAILRIADFPTYFKSLTIRKAVPAEVAAADPRTAELTAAYLGPLGISSMLDAGIFVRGELVGVVCHEHVGLPREWTTEARDFAGSVADLLALRIQSAEADDLRTAFRTQLDRLAAVEKAEALEQMAAGLAHDFRNLLTVALGNAEMLGLRTDLPTEATKCVTDLLSAARRGVGLVNELLEFARPADRPPAVVNLGDVTAEFLPVLQATVGRKHQVRYTRPPAVGAVLLDKGQFTRLLLNLATNARDAMPDGGEINVRVAPVRLPAGAEPSGNFVMVEVADSGAGMDEATRRRAFEPFFTTKEKGTGIGLAVVRRVADRAGGLVRIESTTGKGTAVRAFFPRVGASSGGTSEFPALLG
jgi:two-component system, cell cycle sensor histidine kinase and response regulator CckA